MNDNPDLPAALAAMDILNRWVRKAGCQRPRKAAPVEISHRSQKRVHDWSGLSNRAKGVLERYEIFNAAEARENGIWRACGTKTKDEITRWAFNLVEPLSAEELGRRVHHVLRAAVDDRSYAPGFAADWDRLDATARLALIRLGEAIPRAVLSSTGWPA